MAIQYNAFISYRHHPEDIRAATQIQRSLERFRVPKALRGKVKLPLRLFRDKDELPITSNLTGDIFEALENSDFLIVICSVHTKESMWVQREIETFLKTHSRDKVLTVLVNGEPYGVIPEILLYREETDPVTGEVTRVPMEPLSCDWRMGHRKAMREELPRLAAALLHCGYDELRQRQKQYRMKRLITVISLALAASMGLAAYFLYTSLVIRDANIQIQKNLEESQRNRSRHLATAAWERLTEGDRLTAISLAMAALSDDESPLPYVPEAEYALSTALGVYDTSGGIAAVGAIGPGSGIAVQQFCCSEDERYLYLRDNRNMLTIWDTGTQQRLGEVTLTRGLPDRILPVGEGNVLVLGGMEVWELACFSPEGTLLWELADCRDVCPADADTVIALREPEEGVFRLEILAADSGEAVRLPVALPTPEEAWVYSGFCQERCSLDLPVVLNMLGDGEAQLRLVDLASEHAQVTLPCPAYLEAVSVIPGDKLLVMTPGDGEFGPAFFEGDRTTAPNRSGLSCYDTCTGQLLWETEVTAYDFTGLITVAAIPGSNKILCQSGSAFHVLDAQTGELLSRCEAGNGVIFLTVGEQFASAMLMDGFLCNYWYEDNYCYETKCMEGNLWQAHRGQLHIGLQLEASYVTLYRQVENEPAWRYDFGGYLRQRTQRSYGNLLAFTDYDHLYLFDMEEKTLRWKREKTFGDAFVFSTDGSTIRYVEGESSLVSVDTATGEVRTRKIPLAAAGVSYNLAERFFFHGDQLYYFVLRGGEQGLLCWDMNTDTVTSLPMDSEKYLRREVLGISGDLMWLWTGDGEVLEWNTATEESRLLLEGVTQRPHLALREDGTSAAITAQGRTLAITPGEDALALCPGDSQAGWAGYYGDWILQLCDNGILNRYDGEGVLLGQTELAVGGSFGADLLSAAADLSQIVVDTAPDGKLVLRTFDDVGVIDCESWILCTAVENCAAYYAEEDSFLCLWQNAFHGYPRYDVAKLLQEGEEQLGSFRLSPQQQLAYGIGE